MLPILPEDLLIILSPRLDATGVTDGGTRSSSSIGRIAGIEVIQSDTILVVLLAARSWRLGDLSSAADTPPQEGSVRGDTSPSAAALSVGQGAAIVQATVEG
mmetsp:Transcript_20648/g.42101  ORF Transcript_20648/g.42101 Transcript_20648/m.42101 type:complete len:102 (-) Transcript_20648:91-396(-)